MNCSGKHAAMLATCRLNGWDVDGYREPDHPLQQAIPTTLEELTGHEVTNVAVDGCGAPLFSTTLVGLARAFSRLATATGGSGAPGGRGDKAPSREWVSGSRRDEAALLKALPGAVCKAGAESCYALAPASTAARWR